jgi:uncharacterized protein YndB with AHSA1/START domain
MRRVALRALGSPEVLRITLIGLAVVVASGLVLVVVGVLLPATTRSEREALLRAPVPTVFATVTDVADQARWRSDVERVQVAENGLTWRETTGSGVEIAFRLIESRPNEAYVIEYESPQGFKGRWTGHFVSVGDATRLTMTETVTIASPIGRVIGRLVAPPGAHMERYLADLQAALEA